MPLWRCSSAFCMPLWRCSSACRMPLWRCSSAFCVPLWEQTKLVKEKNLSFAHCCVDQCGSHLLVGSAQTIFIICTVFFGGEIIESTATPTYCFDMMAWEPPYAIHTHTHTLRWPVMVNVLRCLERGAAILHSKGATLLLRGFSGWLCASLVCIMRRVGQNRIYTYIYTVYLVVSKPKIPYVHRIYMVLANPRNTISKITNKIVYARGDATTSMEQGNGDGAVRQRSTHATRQI